MRGDEGVLTGFMNDTIFEHFARTVADYDTVADKVVMKNSELQNAILGAIPFNHDRVLRVLDLGSGTGFGSGLILKKFPGATVTGVDFSLRMNEKAQVNLREFGSRFGVVEKNITTMDFGSGWDVVVSGVTIHNITNDEKRILFQKIFGALVYGGVFVNGDFIAGETSHLDAQYRLIYRKYMENRLKGEELQVWLRHAFQEDMPMKLSKHFSYLHEVGFSEVYLLWQFNNEAVYAARK